MEDLKILLKKIKLKTESLSNKIENHLYDDYIDYKRLIEDLDANFNKIIKEINNRYIEPDLDKEIIDLREFYNNILNKIIYGVWITNSEDNIFFTNNSFENIAAISKDQIMGFNILKDFPENVLKNFRLHYKSAKNSLKSVYYNDVVIMTPTGLEKHYSGWLIPRISKGSYNGIICIIEDISKSKKYKEELSKSKKTLEKINKELEERVKNHSIELKKSEKKYKEMLNNLDVGFFKTDLNSTILFHNPALSKILGFEPSYSLVGRSGLDFWENPKMVKPYFKNLKKKGISRNFIHEIRNIDGEIITLQVESHIIKDENNVPIEVEGIIWDITEKKLMEKKLKESEENYRNIINNISDIIMKFNFNGEIVYVSPQIFDLLGYKENELLGQSSFEYIHPDDVKYLKDSITNTPKYEGIYSLEFRVKHKHGYYIPISARGSAIKEGGKTRIVGVLRDISQKKEAEKLIQEEIKKLKEIDQIKSDFIDRASHELKTPLNSIYSASNFLLDYYKDYIDDKAKELLKIIKKGGERLTQLIDDLLDVSKLESNKLELKKQEENISKIIYECVNDLNYLAEKRQVGFKIVVPDELFIDIDKIRFEQVILNLISNAIKNTPPKGIISIDLKQYQDSVNIIIKDTGVGFTDDEKKKVFVKFGKIERYGKGMNIDTEGSGLGLYISKKIVELHNGKIWIESKGRNHGSKIVIKLPINKERSLSK